jgi:hypothetical protein
LGVDGGGVVPSPSGCASGFFSSGFVAVPAGEAEAAAAPAAAAAAVAGAGKPGFGAAAGGWAG